MRSLLLFTAAALATAPAIAAAPRGQPKLIVAISVDQFAADLFDRYRAEFTGGFARLAREGTVFRNGYQSHAATETCPGHSTILTGDHPSETGIIANDWVDQGAARADKHVYCAEDEAQPETSFTNYKVSPLHLRVQTLGDRLKAVSPQSRNVAIAGKDRAAIMMGGRNVDQRWYWDGKSWTTDTGKTPPRTIAALNQLFAARLAQPSENLVPPTNCTALAKPYQITPTLTVGNGNLQRAAGDMRFVRAHPDFDGAVLAGAAALVGELGLGKGPAPDVLSVGLSATDYVGHAYGNRGQEMCLQLLALDRELGDFLTQMDRTGIDYALVLTADHGGLDIPERLRDQGVTQAQRADPELAPSAVGKLLAPQFGRTEPVLVGDGIGADAWLDKRLDPATARRVLAAAVARYKAHPQVYAVYTKAEIMRVPVPHGQPDKWSVIQRVRASYEQQRSGDFYVVLKQYVSAVARPAPGYTATHGSVWDYDRRVPIIFWRRGAAPADRPQAVETVDILPTLAPMIGLKLTAPAIDGRCLDGAAGVRCR
ncbi:alkaline phosphatase family protein [Sphingomonas sp. KRR8]|uniref:alkaline phosphatase family protein n=1 Tax=Sphingomonas sp. KRR8 TaxID=2942996 RepID=UPI00202120DC|nr:alkaline phosphatase family protein [Sphingomonas sp. KRR8]URD61796.1 alkaline phosphatase family protein [Sphingomonas sp. KRR8]